MKFTVEIDDEDSISRIESDIGEEIARRVVDKFGFGKIEVQAKQRINDAIDKIIEGFKKEMSDWDKSRIVFELERMLGNSWKNTAIKGVTDELKKSPEFIGKVSQEIIKQQFK